MRRSSLLTHWLGSRDTGEGGRITSTPRELIFIGGETQKLLERKQPTLKSQARGKEGEGGGMGTGEAKLARCSLETDNNTLDYMPRVMPNAL